MKKLILTLGLIAGLNCLYAEDGTVKITSSKELKLRKELKAYIEKLIEVKVSSPLTFSDFQILSIRGLIAPLLADTRMFENIGGFIRLRHMIIIL